MAELTGKIEYPGLRRQITANGDDPRVSYGVLSGPRNASGFRYPSDAVITVDGHGTYTIPKNTGLYIWQGSQAATDAAKLYQMDLTTKRWRIFYVPGASRLYACPEQEYGAVAAATDVLRVEYQTQASMWRRSQRKIFRGCTNANPTPALLTPRTNPITFPMASGTPLASADLRHLRGLAYDGTTGTLILSIGIGHQAQTTFVSANNDRIFYSGADGILHDTGLCAATSAYDSLAGTAQATYWAPQGWSSIAGPFHFTIAAPFTAAMCCRGGKLYTIQFNQFATLGKSGHFETYGLGLGLIRSFDLTTHVEAIHAAVVYAQARNVEYLSAAYNTLTLAVDSAGAFYTGFAPAALTQTSPATWSFYGGILKIPNPGAGVTLASSIIGDPSFPALNPPDTAWAGGIGVNQSTDAAYAEGLFRTAAATGLGDHAVLQDNGGGMMLGADAHDNVLLAAAQIDVGTVPLHYQYLRSIDAATGAISTIMGNFHDRDATTVFSTYAGLPAYAGDTAAGHDGNAANSLAATWGGNIANYATDGGETSLAQAMTSFVIDRTTNILYYIDRSLAAIRSVKLDDGNLLCTLTGGPSWMTVAGHGSGLALGPAQQMRGYPVHLAIDESSGNLYYTLASVVGGVTVYDLYRARFY